MGCSVLSPANHADLAALNFVAFGRGEQADVVPRQALADFRQDFFRHFHAA